MAATDIGVGLSICQRKYITQSRVIAVRFTPTEYVEACDVLVSPPGADLISVSLVEEQLQAGWKKLTLVKINIQMVKKRSKTLGGSHEWSTGDHVSCDKRGKGKVIPRQYALGSHEG